MQESHSPNSNVNQPRRRAAIKARQRIAEINLTKTMKNANQLVPMHGWDYSLMMEQYLNEEFDYTYPGIQETSTPCSSPIQSSYSPTTTTSGAGTIVDNEEENNESFEPSDPDSDMDLPPVMARLSTDLMSRQTLTEQLELSEVQRAARIGEHLDRRNYPTRSWHRRATSQPSDYAVFHKSGRKVPLNPQCFE